MHTDPEGEFIITALIIGAVIGGAISGGLNAWSQFKENGSVNWAIVGINAASGAISGAVATTGIGLFASIGINAGLSALTYTVEQCIKGEDVVIDGLLLSAGSGAIGGLIGGKGANAAGMKSAVNASKKTICRELNRANQKVAAKRIANEITKISVVKSSIKIAIGRYAIGEKIKNDIMSSYQEKPYNSLPKPKFIY